MKVISKYLVSSLIILFLANPVRAQEKKKANPLVTFFKEINYTSQIKFLHDDNIFLSESDEDSDLIEIFTQSLSYRKPVGNHYFEWGYKGQYKYYNEESLGILGHSAHVLYSYRPFNGFSFGFRDDFHWLQDNSIATTLGDRVLALGYAQNIPSVEWKYEISDRLLFKNDIYYQWLDVKDRDNDDYIDNRRFGASGEFQYDLTPSKDLALTVGYDHSRISFPQISEKSAVTSRVFVGFLKKFPGLFHLTSEIGFSQIDMDEETNADDDNIDYHITLETVFSIFTKLKVSVWLNRLLPSLRTTYTQYSQNKVVFDISHMLNKKTSLYFNYTFDRQGFDSTDVLAGGEDVDRKTIINSGSITVSRKLKKWLTLDCKYERTHRNSEFANESYVDNQFSVALTAKY